MQARYKDTIGNSDGVYFAFVVLDVETKSSTTKNLQSTLYPIYPFTLLVENKVFKVVLGFDHRDRAMVVHANLERVRVETNFQRG